MKDIEYAILGKMINETIRLSQNHKDVLYKLKNMGYVEYVDGEWIVTKDGISEFEKYSNS